MNKVYLELAKGRERIKDAEYENGTLAERLIVEEPAELIQAISKRGRLISFLEQEEMERLASTEDEWENFMNGKKWKYIHAEELLKSVNNNINEEIADTLIAIEMIVAHLGIDPEDIKVWVNGKVARMDKRAEEGELY